MRAQQKRIIRSSEMMKQMVIFTCMIALGFSFALTGCCTRTEHKRLKVALATTERERDELRARLETVAQTPEPSHEQVSEATIPGGQLQKQVDELIRLRDALQEREDELTKLRDMALAEAQTAQIQIDKRAAQLQAEAEKVLELQGQLKEAQTAIAELQDRLKL